jgi:hypothetical protein
VDGQRQYPAEPDRWLPEQPDDERGFVPGQRGTERYAEPDRYPAEPDGRYPDDTGRRPYGEPQTYGEQPYADPPAFPEDRYEAGEPPFTDPSSRRRRPARPPRVGLRSGLEMPEAVHDEPIADEPPRYRAEMIDRQSLRREGGGQAYQSQRAAGFDEPVEAYPTYAPASPAPQPSAMIAMPLQAPTQAIPSSSTATPAAVYLARRPAAAAFIGTVAVVIELLLVPVLIGGLFSHGINAGDVLGGIFGLTGVPMVAMGIYAVARGAATAHGPDLARTWLRPPLAYLPIGLILILAAGLAA